LAGLVYPLASVGQRMDVEAGLAVDTAVRMDGGSGMGARMGIENGREADRVHGLAPPFSRMFRTRPDKGVQKQETQVKYEHRQVSNYFVLPPPSPMRYKA
jgi:hypothetical protein